MVIITVKSDVMEVSRSFRSDRQSVTFLKRVKKLHETHAKWLAGNKPKRADFIRYRDYKAALKAYNKAVAMEILALKINIEPLNQKICN